jgi:hypothetical protein
MGQTLASFKKTPQLLEIISELFDTRPFKNSFTFQTSDYADFESEDFKDMKGNHIKIYFTSVGDGLYELEFSVNGTSYEPIDAEYNLKDYSALIATIAKGASTFIKEFSPQGLLIKGSDAFGKMVKKPKSVGQKDRLYLYYISQIEDDGRYMIDKTNKEGIALVKK